MAQDLRAATQRAEEASARALAAERELVELRSKAQDFEKIRRNMHNTIQELKGNIRVFCRVRPPMMVISSP